jgi:hypothetical protein
MWYHLGSIVHGNRLFIPDDTRKITLPRFYHHYAVKKLPGVFGGHVVLLAVHRNPNPGILALLHAEAGFEVYLIVKGLLLDKMLEGLDHIVGPLDMAGTADTNAQLNHVVSPYVNSPRAAIRGPGL